MQQMFLPTAANPMSMPEYRIYNNDELVTRTDWPPLAVAAWHRATRDTFTGQAGGDVVLLKNGHEIARTQSASFRAMPWPDGREPDLADLAAAIQQLARHAGVSARDLSARMTESGLATSRRRVELIRTGELKTCPAELIALCYAAISSMKGRAAE